jgi:hypothetical protein
MFHFSLGPVEAAPFNVEPKESPHLVAGGERPPGAESVPDKVAKKPSTELSRDLSHSKYLHFNFPEEGPESAMLADVLSRMAVRTMLEPLARLATMVETVDGLTYSLYTTMLLMGTLIFGVGILLLTWKVYLSVREAAISEPVTLSFLCTIPGLRYLQNHIRYHLWDMPLAPRRRFASFVGASGSHLNLLDLEERPASEPRGRRESFLRHESFSNLSSNNSSNGDSGSKSRRKSVLKPITPTPQPFAVTSKQKSQSQTQDPSLRKRHSVTITTPPASVKQTSSSGSPSPVPEVERRDRISSTAETAFEELHHQEEEDEAALPPEIAAPSPRNVSIIPQLLHPVPSSGESSNELETTTHEIGRAYETEAAIRTERMRHHSLQPSNSYVPPSESSTSGSTSRRFSLTTDGDCESLEIGKDHPNHSWTPVSTASSEQDPMELNRRRADWVRNMPLFNNDYSFLPPEVYEMTNPAPVESKLSRRFVGGNTITRPEVGNELEQSKLSRYFTTSSNKSSPSFIPSRQRHPAHIEDELDGGGITKKIHEGDLTPPPGFGRRHSITVSSQVPFVVRSEDPVEADDHITLANDYHAAFLNASQRRASFLPVQQSRLGRVATLEGERVGAALYERRRVNTLTNPTEPESSSSWQWFVSTDDNHEKEDTGSRIARPHSTIEGTRINRAPTGYGTRSTGRATPEMPLGGARRPDPSTISLGIFDDIFSRG